MRKIKLWKSVGYEPKQFPKRTSNLGKDLNRYSMNGSNEGVAKARNLGSDIFQQIATVITP